MKALLRKTGCIATALFCLTLASCLGSQVKTLGQKQEGGTGTPATDSDSFAITVAFREDANPADGKVVQLQGVRNLASAKLLNICSTNATNCACDFFKGTSDSSPAGSTNVGISDQNNSISCTMDINTLAAPNNDPDTYTHVKIKTKDGLKSSGLIQIKTTLALTDVLGDLEKQKVRKIFRYSCNRTFFEGEGVTPSNITCILTGHQLGIISATYDFYLFQSALDGNMNEKGGDTAFDTAICGYTAALKISCQGSTPSLRYGLYAEQSEPFMVAVSMTSKPEGAQQGAIYGFAALPDSSGNCPTGLVKIRPHVAQPASLIQGANTGSCAASQGQLSSMFVNNNSLNNTLVEEPSQVTETFNVTRQPNTGLAHPNGKCKGDGDCTDVKFGGTCIAQQVAYTAQTPVVCAIPASLASGAF